MIGFHLWKHRSQHFKPETGGEPDSGVFPNPFSRDDGLAAAEQTYRPKSRHRPGTDFEPLALTVAG